MKPTHDVSPSKYLPCKYCLALFVKNDLWKHQKKCKLRPEAKSSKRERVQASATCLIPNGSHASEESRKVTDKMRVDLVSMELKSDPLICTYAELMYDTHEESQLGYCAQKMRELGRFILAVKRIDPSVKTLREVCVPARFKLAVSAALNVCGYLKQKRSFNIPSLACRSEEHTSELQSR